MSSPIEKNDPESRALARRMRDRQWEFADKVLEHGTVWFCWWDKAHRHASPYPSDLYVTCLISGVEMLTWLNSHKDWWIIGDWDDAKYAAPVQLTDAGRASLKDRSRYDHEPVFYGFVEPGFSTIPAEKTS